MLKRLNDVEELSTKSIQIFLYILFIFDVILIIVKHPVPHLLTLYFECRINKNALLQTFFCRFYPIFIITHFSSLFHACA